MRDLPRLPESTVATALKQFPAVVRTGPRRAGARDHPGCCGSPITTVSA